MGKTASITLLAGLLLLASGAASAHPAYGDSARGGAHAHPGPQHVLVPGHWEQRGRHHVWVEARWVVAPRHAGPASHSGYGPRRDRDRDGIPNRFDRDRDGDGVPNRFDRAPDHRRWH